MSKPALHIYLNSNVRSDDVGPCLLLEGETSLQVKGEVDFIYKFRTFLDDLSHLKYLDRLSFHLPARLSSDEKKRMQSYANLGKEIAIEVKESLGGFEDSLLGIRNIFSNINTIIEKPDLSQLRVKPGFSAVVISAGPSLENEFSVLQEIQNKALLVCVDASFRRLLKENIKPHIVVSTERNKEGLLFFSDLPPNLETLLLGQPTIPPEIYEYYNGPKACVFKYTGPFMWFPFSRPMFWAASSSAHLAYRVACHLGASSVALVGQDLCYHSETFQSHANLLAYPDWAAKNTAKKRLSDNKGFFVKGNTFEKVMTNPVWDSFSMDFSYLARETKIPTFNTSVFGREIGGIDFRPLQAWVGQQNLRQLECCFPVENKNASRERTLFESKTFDAIRSLQALQEEMKQKRADEEIARLYSQILGRPHFLELVMELVISDYANCESQCFAYPKNSIRYQRDFLQKVSPALEAVLKLLSQSSKKNRE